MPSVPSHPRMGWLLWQLYGIVKMSFKGLGVYLWAEEGRGKSTLACGGVVRGVVVFRKYSRSVLSA
jgi:hypothetical protein